MYVACVFDIELLRQFNPIEVTSMTTSPIKESTMADRDSPTGVVPTSATSWIQAMGRWNIEIASLCGKRMQYWSTFPMRLIQCSSSDDLNNVQDEFSQTLLTDYRAAAEKLVLAISSNANSGQIERNQEYATTLLKAQEDAGNIINQARAQAKRIVEEAQSRVDEARAKGDKTKAA